MTLRPFTAADSSQAAAVFRDAIERIAAADYSPAQCRAWAAHVDDEDAFGRRLGEGYTRVAEDDQGLVAFGQLHPADHVEYLYCHSRGRGRGHAAAILGELEAEARRRGQTILCSEASLTARPFFEKHGYRVLAEETVQRGAVGLRRFRMSKSLG